MNRKTAIVGIPIAGCVLVSCIAFALMERHWSHVTSRLTEGMARDMAAIVDLYEASSSKEDIARLIHTSLGRLGLSVAVLPSGALPPRITSGTSWPTSRTTWRSVSCSTGQSCASSRRAGRSTPPTLTSS